MNPATTGASAVGPGASAASGGQPPQGPHTRQAFNQKSVFGAGPLSNTGIAGVGMNLNPVHDGLAMKQANQSLAGILGELAVKIDRPRRHIKTFRTPTGPAEKSYPVGSGGPHHGRFTKGYTLDGGWKPDERKLYAGPSEEELTAVRRIYDEAK